MTSSRPPSLRTAVSLLVLASACHLPAQAGEDVKVLLEILLEKGVITQEEFDKKLKKISQEQEVREFNQAQDIRKATKAVEQRAETERKFRTEIYGQVSAGWYEASHMTFANKTASGMSDQPKGNNRLGLKVARELEDDVTAMVTLESNFSSRTGDVGRDSAAYGQANNSAPGVSFLDREANVRLISKAYGTFVLGRGPTLQNDLSGAFDARQNWNFGGLKSIGRYAGFHSASGINRADRLFRYISPTFSGFNIDAGVSFGGVPSDGQAGNNLYFGGRYKNGNFEAGYNHAEVRLGSAGVTSTADVNNRVDFFAAKYTIDKLTINGGYVMTRNPASATGGSFDATRAGGKVDADTWFTGAVYRFTPALSWNAGYYEVRDLTQASNNKNGLNMLATGLTWSPFKDWDFFIDYATSSRKSNATGAFTIYDKWAPDTGTACTSTANNLGCSDSKYSQSGLSMGAQYKF